MKKHSRIVSFLAGAVMTLVLCMSVTTALAVSGNISFNQIQVTLNGKTIASKGEDLTLSSGAKVPSSILYTDTNGNGTTYLPFRKLSENFDIPFSWDGGEKRISIGSSCLSELLKLPLNCCGSDGAGAVFNNSMNEVLPIVSSATPNLLSPVHHQAQTAFETKLPVDEAKGNYISVIVTNHGDYPVEFRLGVVDDSENQGTVYTSSMVPADSTVTRTMRLLDGAKENIKNLYTFVGYQECPYQECRTYTADVTVAATQFEK